MIGYVIGGIGDSLKRQEAALNAREKHLKEQETQLKERAARLSAQETQLKERAARLDAQETQLKERAARLDAQERQLKESAVPPDAGEDALIHGEAVQTDVSVDLIDQQPGTQGVAEAADPQQPRQDGGEHREQVEDLLCCVQEMWAEEDRAADRETPLEQQDVGEHREQAEELFCCVQEMRAEEDCPADRETDRETPLAQQEWSLTEREKLAQERDEALTAREEAIKKWKAAVDEQIRQKEEEIRQREEQLRIMENTHHMADEIQRNRAQAAAQMNGLYAGMNDVKGELHQAITAFTSMTNQIAALNTLVNCSEVQPAIRRLCELYRTMELVRLPEMECMTSSLAYILQNCFGVQLIQPRAGMPFDSELHERKDSMMRGSVISEVCARGWRLQQSVLLRALVETKEGDA